MTAHRPRGRAARTLGRLGAAAARRIAASVAVAGVAATAFLGAGMPAAAATPTPSPTPTVPTGVVEFTLAPVGSGIVERGGLLAASLSIVNGSAVTAQPGRLVLELAPKPIADRARLEAWLDGDTTGVATREVATVASQAVEPGTTSTSGIVVPANDAALTGKAPGVYPLLARYESPGGELVSTSAMIVPRTTGAVTPVAVVVPITAGQLQGGLLTADELTALTAPDGSLYEQLEAVSGTNAILAVDPAIPAAIRVLGDAAPPDALAWLERLMGLSNARFALQFGDADIASQLASGLSAPLQPRSLQSYMTPTDFPPETPTAEPTPQATETPDEPSYPDLEELLDIGGGREDVFWPVPGTADTATVEKLGALGTDDVDAITLIPSATIGAEGRTIGAPATVGKSGARAFVYDSAITAALYEASTTTESVLRGRPLAKATALMAVATASAGETPLLVSVDRGTDRSRFALGSAIDTATQLTTTRPTSLGSLATVSPSAVTIKRAEPDADRAAVTSALRSDEDEIVSFSSILTDATVLTGPQRASILQLLGAAWVPDPAAWQVAVSEQRTRTTTTLDSVGILPPSHINLATSGSALPFWVRNDLPYPVSVILYATPDDLRLDVERATTVEASASSNTRVEVPVQAQVGSGEVEIELQLRSRTSVPIGSPQFAQVTVRADWEGIGVAVILILVGGLVTFGLVRTILRRRSTRRSVRDAAAPGGDGDSAPPGDRT